MPIDLSKRSNDLERLDTGDFTPAEYARWEQEMWYVHRFFGETRAMRNTMVADLKRSGAERVSVLDVGSGSGGLIIALREQLGGVSLQAVGVEQSEAANRSMRNSKIDSVQADGMMLPFADDGFDHAICTLFLHHLDESSAVKLLREMARVARDRIYVIDLNRARIPYYLYKLFGPIFLQRFTVEDGATSIRRAYRPAELKSLATHAGLSSITVERSAINRLILSGRSGGK
jgi:ubiquinone/menaquinone biosynthesis C-methylase UbiE